VDGDHLVYRARYSLDLASTAPSHRFETVNLDDIVVLLEMLGDQVRDPG